MENVLEYIKFALSHAKKSTLPKGAEVPFRVGEDQEWKYLMGTVGQVCAQALLDAKYKKYYSDMSKAEFDKITKGWVENNIHVVDCEGLLDAYLHSDTNANGNYVYYCTEKGKVAEISRPYVIGEAVFNGTAIKKTHVGWVCGFVGTDPIVVEARGFKYGVVFTQMSKRKWAYRGLMTKKFIYTNDFPIPEPVDFVFKRNLKYGCKGQDVIELKKLLIDHGYSEGVTINTDSSYKFGAATRKLVKQYQKDNGLTVDGIAGRNTITSLGGVFE